MLFCHKNEAKDLNLRVYNSGQGNCAITVCPNGNLFIMDCGSSEGTTERATRFRSEKGYPQIVRDSLLEDIRKEIVTSLRSKKQITIIISHRDKDHYNWIPKIFNFKNMDTAKTDVEFLPTTIIVGTGDKTKKSLIIPDRGKSANKILGGFLYYLNSKGVTVEQWKSDEYKSYPLPFCTPTERPEVLVANATEGKARRDINSDSIIIRFNQGRCSAIFLGDATSDTTDKIIENGKIKRGSTFVIASHHGASTHGSNEVKWVTKSKPHVALFSAGSHTGYKHPKCSVIDTYTDTSISDHILEGVEKHNIYCFDRLGKEKSTEYGVFSTLNEGTINFSFKPRQEEDGKIVFLDRYTVSTDKNSGIIPETHCFSYTGIPESPSRKERLDEARMAKERGEEVLTSPPVPKSGGSKVAAEGIRGRHLNFDNL